MAINDDPDHNSDKDDGGEENNDPLTDSEMHDDSELNPEFAPTSSQLTDAANRLYEERLTETDEPASPEEIKRRVEEIVRDLVISTGLADTQQMAIKLARKISLPALAVGAGEVLGRRLLGIQAQVADPVTEAELLQCLVYQDAFTGNPKRRRWLLEEIFDRAEQDPHVALLDVFVHLISTAVIYEGDRNEDGLALGEQLIGLTRFGEDASEEERHAQLKRRAEINNMLAQRALQLARWDEARKRAEMARQLAREIRHSPTLAIALHHLGLSMMYGSEPHKALIYLRAAKRINRTLGDVARNTMIDLSMAGIHWRLGDYSQAAALCEVCIPRLQGTYRAEAFHYLGLSCIELGRMKEACRALVKAYRIYHRMQMQYYLLQIRHAFAYLAVRNGNIVSAVVWLTDLEHRLLVLQDGRRESFLALVRQDLDEYRGLLQTGV